MFETRPRYEPLETKSRPIFQLEIIVYAPLYWRSPQNWHITTYNKAAEEITGIPREKAIGQICKDVLRANVCETDCALQHTMDTVSPIINRPLHIIDSEGRRKAIMARHY
ncbi:MAG: hypothetical protein WAV28_04345 [Sedimentisphaerales bacterium]